MDEIKEGDVVVLKSDASVRFTVAYVEKGYAKCCYIKNGEPQHTDLRLSLLEKYVPPTPIRRETYKPAGL
ncbi:hypothetical protein SDC9_47083 [bioreactor metagenome]|uniref:Uncharacterized protein n=1 Tax=bioreactor metagenome TaxID=1076179 RepID=A0A644WAM6_9ZZZZ